MNDTIEKFLENKKEYISNLTLEQAIIYVSDHYAHRVLDSEEEKSMYMVLKSAEAFNRIKGVVENGTCCGFDIIEKIVKESGL